MATDDSIDEQMPTPTTPELARQSLLDLSRGSEASELLSLNAPLIVVPKLTYDIEHIPVKNDPRKWSNLRKNASLVLIAFASMIAALASNIQNPAVEEMEADLPATSSQFSLSISTFMLIQGVMPLLWSAVSEVKGRKLVYVISVALFTLASIIVALSHHIGPVIGFRALQAAGSSAVMTIGAASLADIFEPEERGQKMGIYYVAPLLGTALGPMFGGFLTSVWGWRAIFWFLAIFSGAVLFAFIFFFRDTFRRERSLTYQSILKQRLRHAAVLPVPKASGSKSLMTGKESLQAKNQELNADIEKNIADDGEEELQTATLSTVTISITDVSPLKPLFLVLRRKNNFLVLLSSGLLFSYGFLVAYASARTLGRSYHYGPLKIGLVTLSYGAGCVFGSILGGRWSDRELARLKEANGDHSYPEMRLKSTVIGVCFLPPSVLVFGWLCREVVHVSAICIFLFLGGFFSSWIYATTLAYIVDSNAGRSSTAVAANSAFRGSFAFVATEIAVPLQDGLGDGWLYTICAGLLAFTGACLILLSYKGAKWREEAEAREKEREAGRDN